jgi:transposase-like protein
MSVKKPNCPVCQSQNCVKNGLKRLETQKVQNYKCKECGRQFTGQEKFEHLKEGKIAQILTLNSCGFSQRQISKFLKIFLRSVQHHLEVDRAKN